MSPRKQTTIETPVYSTAAPLTMESQIVNYLVLFASLVAVKGFVIINSGYADNPVHDEASLYLKDWQNLGNELDIAEWLQNNDMSHYDVRSNETGDFNGSAFGNWNRFGYSLWEVDGNNASVSAYTIEKFNVTSDNITLIVPTYYNVQLTGDKKMAQWTKKINSKVLLMNATLITLSSTDGTGMGRLEFKSSESGMMSENETLHTTQKDSGGSTTWHVQRNGVINSYDKYTNFILFEKGGSGNKDSTEEATPSYKTSSVLDGLLEEIFQWSELPSNWSTKTTGYIMGKDNVKRLNTSSEAHYDFPSQRFALSRNSSGYIWNNVHSLSTEMPENFNKILADILEFLF
ncbi:uncharacterized protein LOC135195097 [Macrobrachium nipponense]|uniref:uncharacterized protein LOC135195097 n=1 Tax=Macrobrachium nipponense TaxID=159736 RepID=UPI0030C85B1C